MERFWREVRKVTRAISLSAPAGWTLLAGALTLFPIANLLVPLESWGYDRRLSLRRGGAWPDDLVLIPIDDAAMRKVGRFPWPREKIAELLDDLALDGAKTIIVDLIFGSESTPEGDARLAKSLSRSVIAIGFQPDGDPLPTEAVKNAMVRQAHSFNPGVEAKTAPRNLVPPLDVFAAASAGVGHAFFYNGNVIDGVIRAHIPMMHIDGMEGALPSLALAGWAKQRGIDLATIAPDESRLVLPGHGEIPLFHGEMYLDLVPTPPLSRFRLQSPPRVPVTTVLELPGAPEIAKQISGKLALIYLDSVSVPDKLVTPLSSTTPGGLLNAHVIRTLDSGRFPRPVSLFLVLSVCVAVALFASRSLARRPPSEILAIGAGAGVVVMVAGVLLVVIADRFMHMFVPAAFLLLDGGFLAWHASRKGESERHRLRALLDAVHQSTPSAPVVGGTAVEAHTHTPTRILLDGATNEPATAPEPLLPGPRAPAPPREPRPSETLLGELAKPVEIGRYTVMRAVGRGGMGAIFLARDRDLDRLVALKILEATDEEAFKRFRREAMSVARIVHPNVVQIHEVGFDARVPYLVMEYVPGGSLSEFLRHPDTPSPISWERATRIALGAARGLGAAHVVGIVHRDVKPSNLLMPSFDADEVKIADFGIAKLGGMEALTREGSFVGTIGYMSPEQAMGLTVDARSDVYSLGVAWYRMITGRVAFDGTTAQVLRGAVTQPVPDPRRVVSVPDAVADLMAKMTAVDREMRVRDGNTAAGMLEALLR